MERKSNIETIYQRSITGHSIFEISLVKDTSEDLPYYKNEFFFFISMTPGVQEDDRRSFDREKKITIKTDAEKLIALSHSIYGISEGKENSEYSILVDTSKSQYGKGGLKNCFISKYVKNDNTYITISFKVDKNKPIGIMFPVSEAKAIADILHFMGMKSIELEFESKTNKVGRTKLQNNKKQLNKTQKDIVSDFSEAVESEASAFDDEPPF